MTGQQKKWLIRIAGVLVLFFLGAFAWQKFAGHDKDKNLVSGNGRIEAEEIDIATRTAGRVKDILVNEGEYATSGQVVAVMDVSVLEAQLREAEANLKKAQASVATSRSQREQRLSEKTAAEALVAQRETELENARKHAARSQKLLRSEHISQEQADDDTAQVQSAVGAVSAARALVAAAEASIASAETQVVAAESAVAAAQASVERVKEDMKDNILTAPCDGRVQYKVAQRGEVLGAGGRVLNLVDLGDVYMTFFLPTAAAGRIAIGSEVRLVLDAAPQYVIPAHVSFVSDVAQFTPKTVETAVEREKLMFRVKAQIPSEILKKNIPRVKTGLPGVAYVRLDPGKAWPPHLEVRLPQ
ncbi:MAG: HlyD family secretion protein [Betaproteobacteria bacterium]